MAAAAAAAARVTEAVAIPMGAVDRATAEAATLTAAAEDPATAVAAIRMEVAAKEV